MSSSHCCLLRKLVEVEVLVFGIWIDGIIYCKNNDTFLDWFEIEAKHFFLLSESGGRMILEHQFWKKNWALAKKTDRKASGKTRPMKEEMDGKLFISHPSGIFALIFWKVLYSLFYLELERKKLCFLQRKRYESIRMCWFWTDVYN